MTRILITGVRGKTGAPLAERLAALPDTDVVGGSSDPTQVSFDGVEPIPFSWDDPAGWRTAAEGVDAVYLVRPDRDDAPELIAEFTAAVPADAHVVLLSEQDASSFPPDSWPLRAERAVRESGRSWTFLRPSWFMQVLSDDRFFRTQVLAGELPFASGGARVAWIDARDIAAVAAAALLGPGHAGRSYELSGPTALTLPETAEQLSTAFGRPIAHTEQTIEEAVAGLNGFQRHQFVVTLERAHAGVFAEVTDTVERVTGHSARTLASFAAEARPTRTDLGSAAGA